MEKTLAETWLTPQLKIALRSGFTKNA